MPKEVFFQSSMPRSLSTVFQNIMGQNPDFYVTPTSGLLELWVGARANYTTSPEFKAQDSELMKKAFAGFCKAGMFGYFEAITDKPYVLDKSRGHGVYRLMINEFYPEPKIICLVRDLKDVIASFEKIYRKSQLKADPIRSDAGARGTTVHKRTEDWLNAQNPVGRALERIFEMRRLGYDDKILFVRSEDLVLRPEAEMVRVYDYLGLPYFEHNFDNIEQITKEDDEVYGISPELHTIRQKLEMKPSDARQILGDDICEFLHKNFDWYYEKFRYKKF